MSGQNLSVSALLRQGKGVVGDLDDKRRSKNEYREQKDLEEQRKAGTAAAIVDIDTGRDINPHIPEFIERTPWYIGVTEGSTLRHQRPHPEREKQLASLKEWYPKGTTQNVAKKFRRGACENCGAMGHNKKNCLERPRAKMAKHTESNFAPDDYIVNELKMDYSAKRDRWNGFNPTDYDKVVEEHEKMEETRKLIKSKNIEDGLEAPEAEEDEDKYADDMVPEQSVDMDSRTRITVRNLRIREDTAKYLYNLDESGPYYDPKSRSMRENPFANVPGKELEAAKFSGENFIRYTGEVVDANQAQVFAWQARCKGIDIHSLAEPTKLEALKREYEKQVAETKNDNKKKLLEKYGEQSAAPSRELLLAQTENYVEYNRKGKLIKGAERQIAKSRYDEDIHPGNHTSIFGSYYKDGEWGFKCCHSFIKNSYCIGEQGHALEDELPAFKKPRRAE